MKTKPLTSKQAAQLRKIIGQSYSAGGAWASARSLETQSQVKYLTLLRAASGLPVQERVRQGVENLLSGGQQ